MSSYVENYKNIKKALEEAFNATDLSVQLQGIKNAEQQIENYLNKYKIASMEIKKRYDNYIDEDKDMSEDTRRYRAVKGYNSQVINLQELLREGYLYVDVLREIFTGESITYQVGIVENGKFYEKTMSLMEIIQNSTLDVDSRNTIQKAAKLRLKEIHAKQLGNNVEYELAEVTANASTVFSAVYNWYHNSRGQIPKINKGNAYQVYRRLLFDRQGANREPPPIPGAQQIEDVYNIVRKNNAAYYKGGDINDIQVKYLGGKPPSLTTIASIERVLSRSLKALRSVYSNSKSHKTLVKSLSNLFLQKESSIVSEVENAAFNKAKDTIENRINSLAGLQYRQT